MTGDIPRRRFLGRSLAAAATIVAFDPVTRTWVREARADTIPIPSLDGMLVEAGPLLAEAAEDFGHIVSRTPIAVLIPAFTLSELKVAFKMGFLIYIPFLIVDIVVASPR